MTGCLASGNPLADALQLQLDASRVGFDWREIHGVLDKVREELAETEAAVDTHDMPAARLEVGDLLFAVVNLARFVQVDPAAALSAANDRFRTRFARVEEALAREGRRLEHCSIEEMDAVWERVKSS